MNKRLLTILLLAFVIAGACAFLVYRVVGNRLGAAHPMTTRVVAAASDIKIGAILTPTNLTTIEIEGGRSQKALPRYRKNAIGRGVVQTSTRVSRFSIAVSPRLAPAAAWPPRFRTACAHAQ